MKKIMRPKRSNLVGTERPKAGERAIAASGGKAPRLRKPRPIQPESSPIITAEATDKLAKVAGVQAVAALFKRDPQRVMRLYYDDNMKIVAGAYCAQLARLHRPYRLVDTDELTRIAGTPLHGGLVAAALPKPLPELDISAAQRWAKAGEPLLILDGVGNPHNLGAIARTMAFFGIRNLIISDHPAQAGLSDAAYRVAEGGLEYLGVYRASHLPQTLKHLRPDYRVIAASLSPRALHMEQIPVQGRPLALVLGNEEAGLSPDTQAACEFLAAIPGSGWVQSLNVSVAAALFIQELAVRRRRA